MTVTSQTLPVAAVVSVEILIAFRMGCVRVTYLRGWGERALSGFPSVCGHNLLPKIGNSCEINFVFFT